MFRIFALGAILVAQGGPELRLALSGGAFEMAGLPAQELVALARLEPNEWQRRFAVYVAGVASAPPVLGTYSIVESVVRFTPRFSLQPGLRYRAVFRREGAAVPIEREFAIEKPAGPPARLEAIYPNAHRVPENLLKLYLYFSAPMRRGEAYRRVHLYEADSGAAVDLPFLELDEELWDLEGRRLTLLFDPGRIKRGLRPREEAGPILVEGRRYRLVVERDWADEAGDLLAEGYRREFEVGPPDERQPDPKRWRISAAPSGSRSQLAVDLGEPLDHAMLLRVIRVETAAGNLVAGRAATEVDDARWIFTPTEPWNAGDYRLSIESTLEDLAGNSIERPFEVDLVRTITRRSETRRVYVPFRVR